MAVAIILKTPDLKERIDENKIIYADAAYKFSDALKDKTVLGVVGDFDSLGYVPKGEKIVLLEEEKNFTDGERAILYAKECGEKEVVIYGACGGKIEHILGNIALLKIAQKLELKARIKSGNGFMELLGTGKHVFNVRQNSKVSLIPYGGNCEFSCSGGLYYPLDGLTLTPADTRGISNVAVDSTIEIVIIRGDALIAYEK